MEILLCLGYSDATEMLTERRRKQSFVCTVVYSEWCVFILDNFQYFQTYGLV